MARAVVVKVVVKVRQQLCIFLFPALISFETAMFQVKTCSKAEKENKPTHHRLEGLRRVDLAFSAIQPIFYAGRHSHAQAVVSYRWRFHPFPCRGTHYLRRWCT